jgi:hypothetical protein
MRPLGMQDVLISLTSKKNVFKPDAITDLRRNDDMVESLEELCKIIASTMKPNIQYLGHRRIDYRIKYPPKYIQMYDSNIFCEEFSFKVSALDENGHVKSIYKKMIFEVPTLLDGCKYYLNGVYFYPMYQLIDATTYHRDGSVCLKTLTIPIKMNRQQTYIHDINNKGYMSYIYTVDMQKKKINLFAFLFATLGFMKSIKFFEGNANLFHIVSEDRINPADEHWAYFQLSQNVYLKVAQEALSGNNTLQVRSMIATIIEAFPQTIRVDQMLSTEFWRYEVLASYFIKTKTVTRSTKLDLFIEAFKRLYDSITEKNVGIYESPKNNIYEVLRWMFIHYAELLYRDNNDIFRKKLRLSESQIAPIVRRELYKMNRVIHSRNRFKDLKKYSEVLTLPYKFNFDIKAKDMADQPSDILVKAIINSSATRYAESTNCFDLLNVLLKYSQSGSSTTVAKTAKSTELSLSQRHVSLSMIGIISPSATGAGDPGSSSMLTPFVHMKDGRILSPFEEIEEGTIK